MPVFEDFKEFREFSADDIEQQEAFFANTLLKLGNQAMRTDLRWLPGLEGETDGVNTFVLGMEPLKDFGLVDYAAEFKETYKEVPHGIVLLGRRTILAMVDLKGMKPTDEGYRGQRLVTLDFDGPRQIRAIPPGDQSGISLRRAWLAGNTGFDDPAINPNHAVLTNNGANWTVHDLRSNNGTFVAVNKDTGRPGYGSRPDDDTEIIAAVDLSQLDDMEPSIHASMTIRAITPHRPKDAPGQD